MSLRFRIIAGCVFIFGLIAVFSIFKGYNYVDNFTSLGNYEHYLREEYSNVEHLSTDTLQTLLNGSDNLLLIDCRTTEEFAVSHIAGAVNLTSTEAIEAYLATLDQQPTAIVTYSAVGRRSVEINREFLNNRSFIKLTSYTASFFAWVNQGLPIVDADGNPTKKIHPFEDRWSRFLDSDLSQNP